MVSKRFDAGAAAPNCQNPSDTHDDYTQHRNCVWNFIPKKPRRERRKYNSAVYEGADVSRLRAGIGAS